MIERQNQRLHLGFGGQGIQWNYFQNSKMVAILDFKMAAIQKSNFAHNSKTKHNRTGEGGLETVY